jgi:methyl-accepting chemotaxis protein
MKSIQTKLTVIILLIFLLAMSTLGGLNYWKARNIITNNMNQNLLEVAEKSAGDISDWLKARKSEMLVLAVSPVVQNGDSQDIAPYLVNFSKVNKDYDTIGYIKPDGTYINSSGATGNLADRDYFKKAIKGETAVSNLVISKSTGKPIVPVAVPVTTDGKVSGVIYGTINMEKLQERILNIKAAKTGYAGLIQEDGLTIVHPDKNLAMKVNALTDEKLPQELRMAYQRMVKGETGITEYNYMGINKMVSYAPVSDAKWFLAINVPTLELTGEVSALTNITMVTIAVVLIITAIVIILTARRIAKPIQLLEGAANRIADGDLSKVEFKINSKDEVGRLGQKFEQMAENLRTLIYKINSATEQVASSSEELTASSEQAAQAANAIATSITAVAAGANEQMAETDNTTIVVEQMVANVQQMAATAKEAAAYSVKAAEKAQSGDQVIAEAVQQMGRIQITVTNSAEVIANLGHRSQEIGQIVDTISGIAGQTNLLALNAAIEAARAGEQGRGFSVVAEEVRKLAEQSQDAAKQIADLIGEIQGDTDKAVVAMNSGTHEVKTGTEVVNGAGTAFREIVGLLGEVSRQVNEISAAMQQMAEGSQSIVASVDKIDNLGKKSASETQGVSAAAEEQLASTEEIASSSQTLAKLAQDLHTAVTKFKL